MNLRAGSFCKGHQARNAARLELARELRRAGLSVKEDAVYVVILSAEFVKMIINLAQAMRAVGS